MFQSAAGKQEDSFWGKVDILLWLGPFQSIGLGMLTIPREYQDISKFTKFPKEIMYSGSHVSLFKIINSDEGKFTRL